MTFLGYFFLGVIAYFILRMLAMAINHTVVERRQKRLLKLVSVTFPDDTKITFIAVDATDKRAMAKLERQIRDVYGDSGYVLPEADGQERRGDRERTRSTRTTITRRRTDPPRKP